MKGYTARLAADILYQDLASVIMIITIKDSIAKSLKKLTKAVSKKITKVDPLDWYAKAKASIAISKTDEPLPIPRKR